MPLSIRNNQSALNLQNILLRNQNAMKGTLSKLSSGYRINTASDGPAALVISEQLRAQLTGIAQAQENTQDAYNLVNTAEGAMNEMSSVLRDMRQLAIAAANTGTMDDGQINALQAQMNSSVSSINRIANTTKFAGKYLLNGSQDIQTDNVDAAIQEVAIHGTQAPGTTYQIDVQAAAQQATGGGAIASPAADTTFRVTGNMGTETITVSAGATQADIETAINSVSANTGVIAQGGQVLSNEYGSNQYVDVQNVSGPGVGIAEGRTYGANVQATVNGNQVTAEGNTINMNIGSTTGEVTMQAGTGPGTYNFDVTEGGMIFQLGDYVNPSEQTNVGIQGMHGTNLGAVGGQDGLTTLLTGGLNSLAEDPAEAVRIIDRAINQVSSQRARLGAFAKNTLQPNINSLGVAMENITATESRIRDANMALQITKLTQQQIQNQAGIGLLSQANIMQQSVLRLLQ